ncbi:MAG: right-handed parallel beta-helix repeat-containing protein [Candidatus Glassbacteria bacterium]|nr:right-handed parallel beta-helix repeat-containing protein [Candidatus Glassbacteria bacterium]
MKMVKKLPGPGFEAILLLLSVFFALSALSCRAGDSTVPGEVSSPYPTVANLAFEWRIEGDDDLDCAVEVAYRMAGEAKWHRAMPLRRIPAGASVDARRPFTWENKLSGSIFDLKPGTEYQVRLRLNDPDGGSAEKLLTVKTRPVPRPAADAAEKWVYPGTLKDSAAAAKPGDILVLAPGYYGDFALPCDGLPGRPVVIRSDRSHDLINSTFDSIDLTGRKHVIIEGVTVYGSIDLVGAEEVAVRHCMVNAKYGIIAKNSPGCKNCYIADNVVSYVMPWIGLGMGCCMDDGGAACVGEGIQLTGPGNVICYNRVSGYRDCISFMEDRPVYDQRCIDVYNNDIYVGADDGIEADFSMGNCRIMRNRLTNCFIPLSSQPGLGGPAYFIRNVMYNVINTIYKLSRSSKGDVVLHNTAVKVGDGFMVSHNPSLALFRNNLMIGGQGGDEPGGRFGRYGSGPGYAVFFPRLSPTCDLDYDGVGTHGTQFKATVGRLETDSFEEFTRRTTEKHAVLVDMSVFADGVEFPDPAIPEREPADLRLRPGSAAVDAALLIPNVNDNFTGKGPDLGAYELGREPPHYGPRPPGVDEETAQQENNP